MIFSDVVHSFEKSQFWLFSFPENYGRTPAYIVKMHLEMEAARRTEAERKRAVKPPLRQLPEDERNELLNVSDNDFCIVYFFFFWSSIRYVSTRNVFLPTRFVGRSVSVLWRRFTPVVSPILAVDLPSPLIAQRNWERPLGTVRLANPKTYYVDLIDGQRRVVDAFAENRKKNCQLANVCWSYKTKYEQVFSDIL